MEAIDHLDLVVRDQAQRVQELETRLERLASAGAELRRAADR
ncbi:MAG: hypothetical protein ACR2FZ_05990 [Thermoleophilaceae bacterium]